MLLSAKLWSIFRVPVAGAFSLALPLADEPIFVVNATRPLLYQRRSLWGEGQLFHHKLELEPLSRLDCFSLVNEILRSGFTGRPIKPILV